MGPGNILVMRSILGPIGLYKEVQSVRGERDELALHPENSFIGVCPHTNAEPYHRLCL